MLVEDLISISSVKDSSHIISINKERRTSHTATVVMGVIVFSDILRCKNSPSLKSCFCTIRYNETGSRMHSLITLNDEIDVELLTEMAQVSLTIMVNEKGPLF